MMNIPTFKIYPARAGLIVRDPRTRKPLLTEGETKPKSGYWLRRLREGSVTTTAPADAVKAAEPVAKPEKAAKQAKATAAADIPANTDGAEE